jgi:hypothetical protein
MFGDYLKYGPRESKVVEGVAMIAGAVVLGVVTFGAADLALAPALVGFLGDAAMAVGIGGISTTLAGIAQDLMPGPSMPFSVRQPAAPRQIVYGQMRVSGNIVYIATSGSNHDLNQVIVWAAHGCESVDTVYLDGRAVVLNGNTADSNDHTDPSGNTYNFGGKVHIFHNLGPVPGTYFSDLGSRDSNWDSSCTLDGLTASYIRCEFDQNIFPNGQPQVVATIHGKNDIWDPRDNTPKYTNNAALVINDFLCNPDYGLGLDYNNEIDHDQLIAAANLCEESIELANGGTESRYTINGVCSTSDSPGDILQAMLDSCGGRIVISGGKWGIYPGAWWGSDLSFDEDDIVTDSVKWTPNAKTRDKCNAVRASFISPNYPYASVGFDQDHRDDSIFQGEWQPTNAPEYAQDSGHGYVSDANLAADGNIKLYDSLTLRFVTSVGQAQRVMKMYLLRKRFAGTTTIAMGLSAYQATAQDVIQMTFAPLGWSNKYFEVVNSRFIPGGQSEDSGDEQQSKGQMLQVELSLQETDPSVYAWSTAEERTIDNSVSPAINNIWQVNPPTSLTLESGLDSAVKGIDGIVQPRIRVTWNEPLDPFVLSGGYVEIQLNPQDGTAAYTVAHVRPDVTTFFIPGVVSGHSYVVNIRAVRPNGAASIWVTAGPHVVSTLYSNYTFSDGSALGALAKANAVDFASGTQVLNRTASNLTYSNGLTAEQLRPAEAGAEKTTGKSIDILVDGVYSKVQSGQVQGGSIIGKNVGSNILYNGGFEQNTSNSTWGDDWFDGGNQNPAAYVAARETQGGQFHNGSSADLLIRLQPNVTLSSSGIVAINSPSYPVSAGNALVFGGWTKWDSNAAVPAGLNVIQRMCVAFYDITGNYFGQQANIDRNITGDGVTHIGYDWTYFQDTVMVPVNASYAKFSCQLLTFGAAGIGNGLVADVRFDDLFMYQVYSTSAVLSQQGSIVPSSAINMTYTCTNNSVQIIWPENSFTLADGTTHPIPAGFIDWQNLTPGTKYYFYPYLIATNATNQLGLIKFAGSGVTDNGIPTQPPVTTPSVDFAIQAAYDGRIPLPIMVVTTLSGSGSGSGTGGGASVCPEITELVEVQRDGKTQQIAAGDVKIGDMIKGQNTADGTDVWRRVRYVQKQQCCAWRIVNGHKVSPCEQVFVDGKWIPAYQASSEIDKTNSYKVLISVEADDCGSHNYTLVSGTPLTIHNSTILPC